MQSESGASANFWRDRLLFVVALCIFAAAFWRCQMVVRWQLNAPYDLVFESPNLATIMVLRHGANIYDPAVFDAPPFVFTLYTPLYHSICAMLPAGGANPFFTGRLVALIFMALSVVAILWVAKPRNWTWLVLMTGFFFLLHPVSANLAFLKNDSTALFFSVLAVLILNHARRTQWRLVLAALFCVLAIAAKQVFVAASATCMVYLFFEQRRDAARFAGYFVLFAAAAAVVAQLIWGQSIWWCVFNAPRMPFSMAQFTEQWRLMLRQPVFLLLLAALFVTAIENLRRGKLRAWAATPFFLYLIFAGAILLLIVGKPGSSTNYFIEFSLAGVFWLVSFAPSSLLQTRNKLLPAAICLGVAVCELVTAKPNDFALGDPKFMAWRAQLHDTLMKEGQSLVPDANPLRILNMGAASTYFDWPGETSVNDPFLYSLLWEHGILMPDSMIRELQSQTYDLVVFRNDAMLASSERGDGLGRIMKALRSSYRPAGQGAFLQYWTRIPPSNK